MQKMIIAGFAGTGKTYLAEKYSNVIDLEPANFKWQIDGVITESSKGKQKVMRKEWPQNYVNKIIESLEIHDIVLIGLNREARDMLLDMGYKYFVCFPSVDRKEEYMERYRKRGNEEEFIKKQEYYFDKELPLLYDEPLEKIILSKNEFLEDYLIKSNFKLIKK